MIGLFHQKTAMHLKGQKLFPKDVFTHLLEVRYIQVSYLVDDLFNNIG